ncbi:MAG: cobalt ECF transporter T component CbiQ [Anaerovorax sp.]
MMLIDKLAYSSALRNKSPFVKCAFAVGMLLICVTARTFLVSLVVFLIMGCFTVGYNRTPLCHYTKLLLVPFTFLILGTVAVAVNFTALPMDLFNLPLGGIYIAVSKSSLIYAVRLVMVALSSVSCLYFLALTTPMLELLYVVKWLHCPALLLEIMLLTYRYIFVLLDMAIAITTAQKCRLSNGCSKSAIKGMGGMLSAVLIRSVSKANFIFDAMESRCYDGELRMLYCCKKASPAEKLSVIGLLAAVGLVALWGSGGSLWI